MIKQVFASLLILCLWMPAAHAVNPDEVLSDPALEERARVISAKVRCLVCQNQSIDDSDATLAKDLRVIVRERLVAGDSNDEVLDFLVARYGEYVLLQPRFASHTLILWLSPFIILLVGAMALVHWRRRQREKIAFAALLSDDDEAALKAILDQNKK